MDKIVVHIEALLATNLSKIYNLYIYIYFSEEKHKYSKKNVQYFAI